MSLAASPGRVCLLACLVSLPPALAAAQTGEIRGTVTSAAATPLPGVQVQVYDSNGQGLIGVATDLLGNYTFTGLPSGNYRVATNAQSGGWINEIWNNVQCPGGCPAALILSQGTVVPVTAPGITSNIDFALEPGGFISGRVTDAGINGLPSVTVIAYTPDGQIATSVFTDALGYYATVRGLPTGTYYLRTFHEGVHIDEVYDNIPCDPVCTVSQILAGTPVAVTAGSTTANRNFALATGASIGGTITNDVTTGPAAGVRVNLVTTGGVVVLDAVSDGAGAYTIAPIEAGTYYLYTGNEQGLVNEYYDNVPCTGGCAPASAVTNGAPVVVAAAAAVTGRNFALAPGGSISGTVTRESGGAAIAGVQVYVATLSGAQVAGAVTNGAGEYSVTGLAAGL